MNKLYYKIILCLVYLMSVSQGLWSQNYEIMFTLSEPNDVLTLQMRNVSVQNNIPATGDYITNISFKTTNPSMFIGFTSNDYSMTIPQTDGLISLNTEMIICPDDWAIGEWIVLAEYEVMDGSTVTDFQIQADTDGDNSDYEDPNISIARTIGYNQVIQPSATILPLPTISLHVSELHANMAKLAWATLNHPTPIHAFHVEKSVEGSPLEVIYTYEKVDQNEAQFEYVDHDVLPPFKDNAQVVYRIIAENLIGANSYSNKVTLEIESEVSRFEVFPNPSQGEFFIRKMSPSSDNDYSFLIYSSVFSFMGSIDSPAVAGDYYTIDLRSIGLKTGTYFLSISDGLNIEWHKLVFID